MREILDRLPPAARSRLADRNLTGARLSVLDWPGDGLVFGGSFAENLSTDDSDLDFVVLREEREPIEEICRRHGLERSDSYASTLIDRILTIRSGVEFDVWLVSERQAADLARVMTSSVGEDGAITALPALTYLETKFLCRLHDGHVLAGDEVVASWRRRLRVAHLPSCLAGCTVVDALSLLEDAVGIAAERGGLASPLGGMIAARAAAERLVTAALAGIGVVGTDLRYAAIIRDRRVAARLPVPAALAELEALLFPAPAALDPYLDMLHRHARVLLGELEHGMGQVVAFLRDFGRGRWNLRADVLGQDPSARVGQRRATRAPATP